MNIFVLHLNPAICAKMHPDKHVVKMILEYAQLMCTAHRLTGDLSGFSEEDRAVLYRSTHVNHPCAIWVRESRSNYLWLYRLFMHLCEEYRHRYGNGVHNHATYVKLHQILNNTPNIPELCMTDFPQCMPDEYKNDDITLAYRQYLVRDKAHLLKWTNRPVPEWVNGISSSQEI